MDCSPGPDAVNPMTQDKFNAMARSVNKDFVLLGYPTILTKKDSRDFVSLCALMQNCSTLLAIVKAKGDQTATAAVASAADPKSHKKRGGLFSSSKSFRQLHQRNAESHARLVTEVSRAMNFGGDDYSSVYEGIVETVRRDTEQVVEVTRCLPEPEAAACEQPQDQQLLLFFTTRWVQFKEAVTRRLLEAGQLAVEVQSLRSTKPGLRSKSVSAGDAAGSILDAGSDCEVGGIRRCGQAGSRQRSLSRHRTATTAGTSWQESVPVSVTKIPSLEAEIRRLKLDLVRREQRHKEDMDRHAKERERLSREFRLTQRRMSGPRWPINSSGAQQQHQQHQHQHQHQQQQQQTSDTNDHILSDVCQTLDRLAECLGSHHQQQRMASPCAPIGASHRPGDRKQQQQQQQQIQAYVDSVCDAALTRIQGLQSDCHTSRRRQADLEVLISILKARLDLTNDQLSDVGKFESAVNDIAHRLLAEGTSRQQPQQQLLRAAQGGGDDHRDSLVSRLTSRLRERQKPAL